MTFFDPRSTPFPVPLNVLLKQAMRAAKHCGPAAVAAELRWIADLLDEGVDLDRADIVSPGDFAGCRVSCTNADPR